MGNKMSSPKQKISTKENKNSIKEKQTDECGNEAELVQNCKKILEDAASGKAWVLFKHGTFVLLKDKIPSKEEASEKSTAIMREYGPVYPGCPAGDFNVVPVEKADGFLVTGHCPEMYTFVSKENAGEETMITGLIGRSLRDKDGKNPEIIHIEL